MPLLSIYSASGLLSVLLVSIIVENINLLTGIDVILTCRRLYNPAYLLERE